MTDKDGEEAPQNAATAGQKAAEAEEPELKLASAKRLHREYSREDVFRSLVQLNRLIGSFEEFADYREGFPNFEYYLETVFLLEDGPYLPGRGAAVNIYGEGGDLRLRIVRTLLEEGRDYRWWAVRQVQGGDELYCEVRVGRFGLPREVRYRSPEGGKIVSRRTAADQYVQRMLEEKGEEELRTELQRRRSREVGSNLPMYYAGLVEERRETISTPAGDFRAVLLQSTGGGQTFSVWFSPDLTGNVLRIVKPGGGVLAEVAELTTGKRRFPEADRETTTPPFHFD
jgi:hypothetical protein